MWCTLTLVVTCVLGAALALPEGASYDARYDNFDAEQLAGNVRLLHSYGNCFLGKGPCTRDGSDFKKTIPEALRTTCAKCTPRQRELIRVVCRAFQEKLPDVWRELAAEHDPDGEYKEAFDNFLKSSD